MVFWVSQKKENNEKYNYCQHNSLKDYLNNENGFELSKHGPSFLAGVAMINIFSEEHNLCLTYLAWSFLHLSKIIIEMV